MSAKAEPASLHEKHLREFQVRYESAFAVLWTLRSHIGFDSVLDVGCGVGAWLSAAQALGVTDVMGVDRIELKQDLLAFDAANFRRVDLNNLVDLGRRFDLTICIEVGEHVEAASSEQLVETLALHSDVVLFSAALPGQGGAGHVNEAWPEVWMRRFVAAGFAGFDLVRPSLWGNKVVLPWVQQNCLLFIKQGLAVPASLEPFRIAEEPATYVHKVTYNRVRRQATQLQTELAALRDQAATAPQAPSLRAPDPAVAPPAEDPARERAKPEDVLALVEQRLREAAPFSLIRLSHCEAKFLNWPDVFQRNEMNRSLKRQFGYTDLSDSDLTSIGSMVRGAAATADVLGVPRMGKSESRRLAEGDEGMRLWAAVAPALEKYKLAPAGKIFTSVNIHLRLQESDFLSRMLALNVPLTLVGCRDLRPEFTQLGFTELYHIPIPEAARTRDASAVVLRHYPDAFHVTVERIRQERRPGLFLVGAGFLGKVYCHEIRMAGGVAVDIGSAMDVWAGVASRTGFETRVQIYKL